MINFEELEKFLNETMQGEVKIYFNPIGRYGIISYIFKGHDLVHITIPADNLYCTTEQIATYLIRKIEEELIM